MTHLELINHLGALYDATPKIDFHTHISWQHPAACGIEELVFYHMLAAEWYGVGLPHAPTLRRYRPDTTTDWSALLRSAAELAPCLRNTALARALLAIGRDVYHVSSAQLDAQFFLAVQEAMALRGDLSAWVEQLFDRMHLTGILTSTYGSHFHEEEFARRAHQRVRLTYERDFLLPTKRTSEAIAHMEAEHGVRITDLDSATEWYRRDMERALRVGARVQVKWFAEAELMESARPDLAAAAVRKTLAGEVCSGEETRALATYMFAQRLAFARQHGQSVQVCSMAIALTDRSYTLPITSESFLRALVAWIDRTPEVTFDILNCDPAAEPFFITLARTRPNVCLSGIWWHAMSDAWIEELFYRRLLTVPLVKLGGFFSDAYCAEWIYGKHVLMRAGIVRALARAIEAGVFSAEDCPAVLQQLLHDTPARLAGLSHS